MSANQTTCPFCDYENISSQIVWETEKSLVIVPHWPRCKGHLLVIPKFHTPNIINLPDEYLVDMFNQIRKAEDLLEKAYQAKDFNILTNQGKLAMQSVFHLHFHILPRIKKETFDPLRLMGEDLKLKKKSVILSVKETLKKVIDEEIQS
jgi:histidine triad (HIT) family protein